ncbi:APC family permease [Ruminococcus sp. AM27-11LB]|jgi:APA family basic amino acid/polyamine antiporter|uniref:APC family permease n=1 Tax=Mediterraneibacter TaxID=2316020 RepID=UPI000E51FA65|nr:MULTISPECIES: APC family permease [Mediterraneibacter]RGF97057.1 APC family permease [Ruminococcus sp. AM49-8]RGG00083.1 APC family permease [Ruminococcus sp. AM49-10BH]RGG18675.1 APC family permease [Ruminococcus sp. AF25-3LB]RGG25107.1 APC family permease [Ruminococcus sp. AF25-17]RGH95544.1 APC family permease [Ruminococcus sp. AM27-27]RGH97788.1 APC family permease [Ruminococcus sp. AM27-11LB]
MTQKKSEFNKVLNAWDILVIAFGAMIGWGWVVSTGGWIEKGGVIGAALGFAIGGIMIFFVGLTYAELTAAMPQCGGEHVFSYRAMGATGSFICTWMIVLGYVSVACFEACAFPTIITYLWPGFLKGYMYTVAGFDIYASWLITAIVIAFLIMMINIIGAKTAAILQTVLTCIIGGAGILLIVASVINGTVDNLDGQIFAGTTTGVNIKAIIGVAAMSPFYFIGFDVIPQAAEEINVPPKKIGNILILSVVLAVIFYAFVIIAVGFVMNPGDIIASQEATGLVTADAMAAAFNTKIMAKVIIVGGMCGIVTSWNSFLLGGSRAMYSMAESYMIPKFFAKLHPKHKTPVNALILIGILTMLAPFAGRKMLVWISDAGNFGCCFAYCMVALSFMILRKKEPDMPRPYKVPCYKFFGTMAVIMSGFMVAMYCIPGSGGNLILQEWLMVLGWSALGVVFYVVCKVKYKESFGTLVEIISDEDAATLMPEADEEELDKVIDAAIDRVLMQKSDLIGGTV